MNQGKNRKIRLSRDGDQVNASLFMNTNPMFLYDTDTIGKAAELIMTHRHRALPVVDKNNIYLGTLGVNRMLSLVLPKAAIMDKGLSDLSYVSSSLDDLRARLNRIIDDPVSIHLEKNHEVVYPDTSLDETLLTLYRTRMNLPVIERGTKRLVGMISYFDIGAGIMADKDKA